MNRRIFLKYSAASACAAGFAPIAGCNSETAKKATVEFLSHLGDLAHLINAERKKHQLAEIPLSAKLTSTAMWHCTDAENPQAQEWIQQQSGDLHSWSPFAPSDANSKPLWSPVVGWVTGKSEKKPAEIAAYTGDGFENAAWSSSQMTAHQALQVWLTSTHHRQVILNQGIWAGKTWKALGAVYSQHFAFAWFGDKAG